MNWRKVGLTAGVVTGVFLGMKYVFPVMLPFFIGWILAEAVHPIAAYLGRSRFCRKLRLKESGIGTVMLLVLLLGLAGFLLISAEYLVEKIGACVKYYPLFRREADRILEHCCVGAERMMGIPSGRSRAYLHEQFNHVGKYFWAEGKGMNTAVGSLKSCVLAGSVIIVAVVSSILFLQEREKIKGWLEKRSFYKRICELWGELLTSARAYLKAQIKIMGIVSMVCVAGLWILKVKHFLGLGLLIGILDAFPVLGTGTFLIPGGIFYLLLGNKVTGVGFFVLYLLTSGVRQFLEPRLVGKHVGISPLLVLLSVYLGVVVYGGFGFILGPLSGLLLYTIFKEGDWLAG